jgi:hypothetical protein
VRRTILVLAAAVIAAAFGESCGSSTETGVYDGGGTQEAGGQGGSGNAGAGASSSGSGACTLTGNLTAGCESHRQTEPDGDASLVRCLLEPGPGFVLHAQLHDPVNAGNGRKLVPHDGPARRVQPLRAFQFLLLGCSRSRAPRTSSPLCTAMGGTWVGN